MATTNAKKAMLKALIDGQVTDLLVKTNAEAVEVSEGVSLASKLSTMASDIADRMKTTDVNAAISKAIDDLIGGAPETYDTLKEIADYIDTHGEVAAALTAEVGQKVDKVEGKGLSTNDYTDEDKAKLESLKNIVVVNGLDSDSTKDALAAAQGKALHDAIEGKVDKVEGKGLSANDYTDEDKAKLAGLNGVRVASEVPADLKAGELLIFLSE